MKYLIILINKNFMKKLLTIIILFFLIIDLAQAQEKTILILNAVNLDTAKKVDIWIQNTFNKALENAITTSSKSTNYRGISETDIDSKIPNIKHIIESHKFKDSSITIDGKLIKPNYACVSGITKLHYCDDKNKCKQDFLIEAKIVDVHTGLTIISIPQQHVENDEWETVTKICKTFEDLLVSELIEKLKRNTLINTNWPPIGKWVWEEYDKHFNLNKNKEEKYIGYVIEGGKKNTNLTWTAENNRLEITIEYKIPEQFNNFFSNRLIDTKAKDAFDFVKTEIGGILKLYILLKTLTMARMSILVQFNL